VDLFDISQLPIEVVIASCDDGCVFAATRRCIWFLANTETRLRVKNKDKPSTHPLVGFVASGKTVRTIENMRRLNFGGDCLPLSWRPLEKVLVQKLSDYTRYWGKEIP